MLQDTMDPFLEWFRYPSRYDLENGKNRALPFEVGP